MNNTLGIISEVIILVFNILIFMRLTVLKRDTRTVRVWMGIGSCMILTGFFVATYFLKLPEVTSSFVFVTIPTILFYWSLSKYKDTRFFVTFCFLDTVTLIVTFFARAVDILFGTLPGIIAYIAAVLFMIVVYIKGKPYFTSYRDLLNHVRDGWGSMALSTTLIYVLLILAAGYPKPLIERSDFIPVYAMLSITILSFYAVFILSLLQKKKLYDLNEQLETEKKWHKIAYEDALTGMKNRMAYMEYSNNLERHAKENDVIHVIMMDIDNFKKINDTYGHHIGDSTLKAAAELLHKVFDDIAYQLFRIGGDEFAVIALNVSAVELDEKITVLREDDKAEAFSFSLGCATADFTQNNAVEKAFIRADREMYKEKELKKVPAQKS